jgi:parallel beta-helix repeat protein
MRRWGPVVLSIAVLCAMLPTRHTVAQPPRAIEVADVEHLRQTLRDAAPGDVITLLPGTYRGPGRIILAAAGTPDRPIVVRAARLGDVRIETDATETFAVTAPDWIFENLDIIGTCKNDADCEHAFHITGRASRTVIRGNRIRDFNAAIKGNGMAGDFPDDVVIEDNRFSNAAPRQTYSPVTVIDIDGGRNWTVRGNFIADFGKALGSRISFGAFMKANSRDGVFERNLVICEWRNKGGTRIGLSFGGGGGETPPICEDADCTIKHTNGTIRNNVIMNCPNDVGIYINTSPGTKIYNNTLFDTFGIDVRFPASSADIRNNVISGSIRSRDGGRATLDNNLVSGYSFSPYLPGLFEYLRGKIAGAKRKYPNYIRIDDGWVEALAERLEASFLGRGSGTLQRIFIDPGAGNFTLAGKADAVARGEVVPSVTEDFCGNPRPRVPQLGAIEYNDAAYCDVRALIDDAH